MQAVMAPLGSPEGCTGQACSASGRLLPLSVCPHALHAGQRRFHHVSWSTDLDMVGNEVMWLKGMQPGESLTAFISSMITRCSSGIAIQMG